MNKTIKARMFEKSEYGFNYFCILDFNYGEIPIENIVVRNQIKCFEFNSMCISINSIFTQNNIPVSYFEYIDGKYKFFNSLMQDITDNIPNSIISSIRTSTSNKVYRHRYIITNELVVVRNGILGINRNSGMEVVKDEIYDKKSFLDKYGKLPQKSFSFSEINSKIDSNVL